MIFTEAHFQFTVLFVADSGVFGVLADAISRDWGVMVQGRESQLMRGRQSERLSTSVSCTILYWPSNQVRGVPSL